MNRKICLITGVSSGIGESLSKLLIKNEWFIVGIAESTELKSSKPLPFTWKPGKAAAYILRKVLEGKKAIVLAVIFSCIKDFTSQNSCKNFTLDLFYGE